VVNGPAISIDKEGDLLVAIAGGDREALARLYDLYAGTLYGWGLRRLGEETLAEDLVQRVMLKVWRMAARHDPGRGSVRTWIFVMARTAVVDLLRERPRAAPTADLPDREDVRVTDELDALLGAEVVRAALDRLHEDHRRVVELAYFGQLTQTEIAARLGIPLGTVKSRSYYALRALRLSLQELGVQR
jgi:RNA polymerase sigma-70 factor (ECF subfamily)